MASWEQHQLSVLAELKRLSYSMEELSKEQAKTNIALELLRFKTSLWGGIAGLASGGFLVAAVYLVERLKG